MISLYKVTILPFIEPSRVSTLAFFLLAKKDIQQRVEMREFAMRRRKL
jgi:hypothetical protein